MKELLLKIQALLSRLLEGGCGDAFAAASSVALSILEEGDLFAAGGRLLSVSDDPDALPEDSPACAMTAAGAACALQKQNPGGAVVAWVTADGLEEVLRVAAALNLPLILLLSCREAELDELSSRVMAAEDIACIPADGRSVMKLMPPMRLAVDRAREGDGPTLIECVSDQADDEEEFSSDPLQRLNNVLILEGYAMPEELK